MAEQFYPKDRSEMPESAELLSRSGFDFMRDLLEGRLPLAPIGRIMGFRPDAVEDGRVVFRGTPEFDHLNPMSGVHGGWYGTILDSAMGCAVMTKVPQGSVYTTLEYKVNLIRALKPGAEFLCEGRVDHAGRSTATASGTIRGADDGKLYATGSTTCLIMALDPPDQAS